MPLKLIKILNIALVVYIILSTVLIIVPFISFLLVATSDLNLHAWIHDNRNSWLEDYVRFRWLLFDFNKYNMILLLLISLYGIVSKRFKLVGIVGVFAVFACILETAANYYYE